MKTKTPPKDRPVNLFKMRQRLRKQLKRFNDKRPAVKSMVVTYEEMLAILMKTHQRLVRKCP